MAKTKKTSPLVDNNRLFLQGVAKNLIDRIYGPNGPPWGTKFLELEDLIVELGKAFQKSMLDQALARQAGTFQEAAQQEGACPGCGKTTQQQDPEPRILQSRAGEAEWSEPHRHCDQCRKAFFPSVPESGD